MDTRVTNQYVKVVSGSDLVIAEYYENARIESPHTITVADTIATITTTGLPVLPDFGQWVEKDKLYNYNNMIVHCIQSHFRTIYAPSETPNLFSVYRVNSDTLPWIINEKVCVDWIRVYNGTSYKVLQAHMTQESWNPVATLGILWGTVPTTAEWAVGVAYKRNDIVTYLGHTYKCLQNHTSIQTWNPVAAVSLWQLQS